MSVTDVLRGRHITYVCTACDVEQHGAALQIGETFLCWTCLIDLLFNGHDQTVADHCSTCWPEHCVRCGAELLNRPHQIEHVKTAHPEEARQVGWL